MAWKHLSVVEPPALTSGVKVSQALPVCGFSQDPLPVGMSAPLLSPHQLRMLLLPSKSFLKPEEKKRSFSMQGSLGVKKETPLNAQFCIFDSILQTRCPLTRAYLWMWGCVSLWGIKTARRERFFTKDKHLSYLHAFLTTQILFVLVIYQLSTRAENNSISSMCLWQRPLKRNKPKCPDAVEAASSSLVTKIIKVSPKTGPVSD